MSRAGCTQVIVLSRRNQGRVTSCDVVDEVVQEVPGQGVDGEHRAVRRRPGRPSSSARRSRGRRRSARPRRPVRRRRCRILLPVALGQRRLVLVPVDEQRIGGAAHHARRAPKTRQTSRTWQRVLERRPDLRVAAGRSRSGGRGAQRSDRGGARGPRSLVRPRASNPQSGQGRSSTQVQSLVLGFGRRRRTHFATWSAGGAVIVSGALYLLTSITIGNDVEPSLTAILICVGRGRLVDDDRDRHRVLAEIAQRATQIRVGDLRGIELQRVVMSLRRGALVGDRRGSAHGVGDRRQ